MHCCPHTSTNDNSSSRVGTTITIATLQAKVKIEARRWKVWITEIRWAESFQSSAPYGHERIKVVHAYNTIKHTVPYPFWSGLLYQPAVLWSCCKNANSSKGNPCKFDLPEKRRGKIEGGMNATLCKKMRSTLSLWIFRSCFCVYCCTLQWSCFQRTFMMLCMPLESVGAGILSKRKF